MKGFGFNIRWKRPFGMCMQSKDKEAMLDFFNKERDLAPQYGYCLTAIMSMVGELRIGGKY